MKLKLVVAASFAAVAGMAHAQSSVTLYGAIDSGLMYQSTSFSGSLKEPDAGSVFRYKDGGLYASFFGLKGSEDIGGGYTVNFKLQGAFDSSSGKLGLADAPGAAEIFNQQSTIGVSGAFGTLDAGRQYAPMIYAMYDTDVRGAQYFGSILTAVISMNLQAGWPGTSTNSPIGALYDDNALVYQSPKLYGASLALEYAPGGVAGQPQGGTRESAVLKYSNYGLNLAAVYYNGHDTNPYPANPAAAAAPATGLDNNRYYYLGAKYTFHGFSVSGSCSNGKNPANSNHVDFDLWSVGLGYRLNPAFEITSGFYYLKDENNSANHSSEFVVGTDYSLSKRTLAYAQVGYVKNDGDMMQMIAYGQTTAPGMSTTAVNIGIRHSF